MKRLKIAIFTLALLLGAALPAAAVEQAEMDRWFTWGYVNGRWYTLVYGVPEARTEEQRVRVSAFIIGYEQGSIFEKPEATRIPYEWSTEETIRYLDTFYAVPVNRGVPVGAVLHFARLRADGVIRDSEVQKTIEELRKAWAAAPPASKVAPPARNYTTL